MCPALFQVNRNGAWFLLLDWVSEANVGYMGVESIVVDPKNVANVHMLAGTAYFNNGKTAILRSSDDGRTFDVVDVSAQLKAHGNGIGRQNGEKLQVDPSDSRVLYSGTRCDGLFKSTDAGATWSRLASLPVTTTPPVADSVNPARFYVHDHGNGRLMVSTDRGVSFRGAAPRTARAALERAARRMAVHVFLS